jgi:hypothetical protein
VTRAALLSPEGAEAAAALALRFDCAVDVIDLSRKGGLAPSPSDWARAAAGAIAAAGVAPARIRIVGRESDLKPCEIVLNLAGFGDRHKVKHLAPVLDRAMAAEGRMILDIRRGSGAFPFLKDYGSTEPLAEWDAPDGHLTRALFTREALADATAPDSDWAALARTLAGPGGFFTEKGAHSFLFVPRDPGTLVVTFDNLDIAMDKREDRRPWGYAFIEKQGWSMLGVMAQGWTWYRDPWVAEEFGRLASEGFFGRFGRVVFYGASMGGYAAAAFVAAAPGADVVAISPQSTLDKTVVPWETRYRTAWGRDFSGPYGDAAEASRAAGRVMILYDPWEPLDAAHAARFAGANVVRLRAPLMGHRLGSSLSQMGVLTPLMLAALDGTLTEGAFHRALRARHAFPRYQRELFERALARGRPGLARKVGAWVLRRGDNRAIRAAMRDL